MALALPDIPIIQISAALDSADDRTWITDHRGAHRVITVPRAVHDYDGAGTPLMAALDESLHWLLNAACE